MKQSKGSILRVCLAAAVLIVVFASLAGCASWQEPAAREDTTTVSETFTSLRVTNHTYYVQILPSDDGSCRAEFDASEKMTWTVDVEEGVLKLKQTDLRKWYEKLGWVNFGERRLTLYLPKGTYDALTLQSGSGSIKMDMETGATFGKVALDLSSGSLTATGLSCGELAANLSSGSIALTQCSAETILLDVSSGKTTLTDVLIAKNASIDLSSGSVVMDRFDSETATIKVSSGSVRGTILTAKNFETKKSSGSITVPPSDPAAGKYRITVSSGSVNLSLG